METTKDKFKLFKGSIKTGDCNFSIGFLHVNLEQLEMDTVRYSTTGFSIGNHDIAFIDLISLDFAQVIVGTAVGTFAYKYVQIELNNGQKFVLFPKETWGGGVDNISKINNRILALFQKLNEFWKPLKQKKYSPTIKRTILDLGTRFTRLQVAEIAESCHVNDEALIIATVQDMIAKHQVDAQYFASTKAIAFNQQANLAARDAFIAELEAEFASWGKDKKQIKQS